MAEESSLAAVEKVNTSSAESVAKHKQLQELLALQKATGNMVVHLSTIANQFSVMKISSGEVAELLTNWKKVFELANTPEDDVLVKLPAIARGPAKEEDIVKVEPTIITTRSGSRQRSAAAAAEAAALAAAAAGARSSKSAAAAGARSSKST